MNVRKATFTEEERAEILGEYGKSHPSHVYRRLLALKLKAIEAMRRGKSAA